LLAISGTERNLSEFLFVVESEFDPTFSELLKRENFVEMASNGDFEGAKNGELDLLVVLDFVEFDFDLMLMLVCEAELDFGLLWLEEEVSVFKESKVLLANPLLEATEEAQ